MLKLLEGQFIKLTGTTVKGENDIYIVERDYTKPDARWSVVRDEYVLTKVKLDGNMKESGYTAFFYNEYAIKKNPNLAVEIVTDLKKSKKEVNDYLKNINNNEIVTTFEKSADQEAKHLSIINFPKGLTFGMFGEKYICKNSLWLVKFREDKTIYIEELGKKGQSISNGRMFGCTLKLTNAIFEASEVVEKIETKKGDIIAESKPVETIEEIKTESPIIASTQTTNDTIEFTVSEDTHTKTGAKIFVAKLIKTVSKDEFINISIKIKSIGGYYSSFKKGFLFKENPTELLKKEFNMSASIDKEIVTEPIQVINEVEIVKQIKTESSEVILSINTEILETQKTSFEAVNNMLDKIYKAIEEYNFENEQNKIELKGITNSLKYYYDLLSELIGAKEEQTQEKNIINPVITDISDKEIFVTCLVPSLNKNNTKILNDEEINSSSYLGLFKITKIIKMNLSEYNYFIDNLLNDFDFLQGAGGWEQENEKLIYYYGLAVICEGKETLIIDPSGSSFARYTNRLVEDINNDLKAICNDIIINNTFINETLEKIDNDTFYEVSTNKKKILADDRYIYNEWFGQTIVTGKALKELIKEYKENLNIKPLENFKNEKTFKYWIDYIKKMKTGECFEINFGATKKDILDKIDFIKRLEQQLAV